MFKRIIKVVGFVLLGFVLLIGGVVAFMAIRGDFKKQVIKPTAINFSIDKTELILDAGITGSPTVANGRVYSFTISAEPLNVTETECVLKLSAPLITFVKWENSEWVKNSTNTFHLNTPIYFVVNNVVEDFDDKDFTIDEEDYYDGVLTITVKDQSGLLQDTLELSIDRSITSISFKYREDNEVAKNKNKIINGSFAYELEESYENVQVLEVIEGEDYPLEVIAAPLKASKPFDSKDSKIYEVYYVEDDQPKLLTHYGEVVRMQRFNDQGILIEEDCEFLRYDVKYILLDKKPSDWGDADAEYYQKEEGRYVVATGEWDNTKLYYVKKGTYVFNSANSKEFEFKLVTYPTYAIQEEILSQELSFIERLKSEDILTKKVVIKVSGTEAEKISFSGAEEYITMNLLQDNKLILNNSTTLEAQDLGLSLSKQNGATEIYSRYNETKFLSDLNFAKDLSWTLKQAQTNEDGEISYKENKISINFKTDKYGVTKAVISGLDSEQVDNTADYQISLTGPTLDKYYTLILSNTEYKEDGETIKTHTEIKFVLVADDITGKTLFLKPKDENEDENKIYLESEGLNYLSDIEILKTDEFGTQVYLNKIDVNMEMGNCFVLDKYDAQTQSYKFKTIQSGVYLALVAPYGQGKELINDKFFKEIDYNGADTIITIKPTDGELLSKEIELYAFVVNANGTWTYTKISRKITINEIDPTIELTNGSELYMPVEINRTEAGDIIDYGASFDVESLVSAEGGSYDQILMFAPRYVLLTDKPAEWGKGLFVYTYDTTTSTYTHVNSGERDWVSNTYYVKNNFMNFDGVKDNDVDSHLTISINDGVEKYYLLGYIDNGLFVNRVVATNMNYHSKIYPVLVKTQYLSDLGRLQTAEEYVNQLLKDKTTTFTTTNNNGDITLDLSLLPNRTLNKTPSVYVLTSDTEYNESKTYYTYSDGTYTVLNGGSWDDDTLYYEKVDCINAKDALGEVTAEDDSNIIANLRYYTLNNESNQLNDFKVPDDSTKAELIANWANYYIIVSEYKIDSVAKDDTKISIKAYPYNGTIKLTNCITFEIGVEGYNLKVNENFTLNQSKYKLYNNVITAKNYYDFDDSNVKPTASFGGTYFDEAPKEDGDYAIIVNHKDEDMTMKWDDLGNPINTLVARVQLKIDSDFGNQILNDLISKISITAREYDSNGNIIVNTEPLAVVGDIHFNDEDESGKYIIYAEFNITKPIKEGHYIEFVWVYTPYEGAEPFEIKSPELRVLPREITGYSIDVGHEELYTASLIGLESAPNYEFYEYDKSNGEFTIVNNKNDYEKDIYYQLSSDQYKGEIRYVIEVGYDTDYTYNTVYATDKNGNYLYYKDDTDNLMVVKAGLPNAFGLINNNGWIKPEPFYAVSPEFKIEGNDYLKFDGNGEPASPKKSDDFTDITLISKSNPDISKTIKAKITTDGNFDHQDIDVNVLKEDLATKEVKIPASIYTYKATPIDGKLEVEITKVSDSALSISEKTKVVDKDGYEIAGIYFENGQWIIRRTTYDIFSLTIKFTSVLGTKETTFKFDSPCKMEKSTTNPTATIYSGTTFVLAKTNSCSDEEYKNADVLYTFITSVNVDIKYSMDSWKSSNSVGGVTNGLWKFTVPPVNEEKIIEFKVYDNNGEEIDRFALTVKPNIIITADTSQFIELDDLNNNSYAFRNLLIGQFDTDETYIRYDDTDKDGKLDNLNIVDDLSKLGSSLNYEYYTYTDDELTKLYTTNVVSVRDDDVLQVNSPISETGTYYVNVIVKYDDVEVGNVKFKISTKSEIGYNAVQEGASIEVEAQTPTTYTQQKLNELFKLLRGTQISNSELTDVLWINTTNSNMQFKYNYSNGSLIQTGNKVKYNDKEYEWRGVSHNMDGYTFDIFHKEFKNADGELLTPQIIGNNIAYTVVEGKSIVYLMQNAYLFAQGNDLIVISIEEDGKTVYKIGESEGIKLGNLNSLELLYTSFGQNLDDSVEYVDTFEYSIDLVYDTKNVIKTNNQYEIHVKPYIIEQKVNAVLSGREYNLEGIFNNNGVSVAYGASADYKIVNQTTIIFNPKGNSYTAEIPVTLTYSNGQTYTYKAKIDVINSTVVGINYPYNVDDNALKTYNTFNASIKGLNGVYDLYDVEDFAKWLGLDTTIEGWDGVARIKYDLALKGDTINLTKDDLRNIVRYNSYTFSHIDTNETYIDNTYYVYDSTIKNFKLVTLSEEDVASGLTQPADWGNTFKYFKRNNSTETISDIKLVAVSSTYIQDIEGLVDKIAINVNNCEIKIAENLDYTGYAAFKVYAGDTGAYGYYVVKIVDDENFRNTIAFSAPRKTQTIPKVVSDDETKVEEYKIINVIRTTGHDIHTVGNFPHNLLNSDSSNVYLFKVSGDNLKGDIASIPNGGYIANNTTFTASNNIQTITVAVVVQSGESLVHVCNYEIILQPDITVTITDGANVKTENANYYIYSIKEPIEFIYSESNEHDVASYFTVKEGATELTLTTVEFDTEKPYIENLKVDSDAISIQNGVDGDGNPIYETIANNDNKELNLTAQPSQDIYFYLKLTYSNGFVLYLQIYINGFEWMPTTQFEVGKFENNTFNNTLNLTQVFGTYTGAFKIESNYASINGDFENTTEISFTPATEAYTITATITLTNVYPNVSKTITIKVNPSINGTYGTNGVNQGTRATADVVDQSSALSETGSQLKVDIDSNTITINNVADNETYLTINVGSFSSVNFTLTADDGSILRPSQGDDPYQYFVGSDSVTLSSSETLNSETLNFVHSAREDKLRLNITVKDNTGKAYATTYVLYITLPKTYELTPIYRVDGAKYETVVNGGELDLNPTYYQHDESNQTYTLVSKLTEVDITKLYTIKAEKLTADNYAGGFYSFEKGVYKKASNYEKDKYFKLTTTKVEINIANNFFGNSSDTEYYALINTEQEFANISNVYIKQTGGYVKAEPKPNFVDNTYYCKVENASRMSIKVDSNYYYSYSDIHALGLFTDNNPNKLSYTLTSDSDGNTSSIDNGEITFRSNDNMSTSTLTLTNATTEIIYKFIVLDEENDYGKVEYNEELLQIGTSSGELDYIVITVSQLSKPIDLAYLNYDPTVQGEVGGIITTGSTSVTLGFVRDNAASDYVSKIVIEKSINATISGIEKIEVTIITVNGVSSSVSIVISNVGVAYGYQPESSYEESYAGTQIGKLSDNLSNGRPRIAYYQLITTQSDFNNVNEVYIYENGSYILQTTKPTEFKGNTYYKAVTFSGYTLNYIGAVNGSVSHLYLGSALDSNLITYSGDIMSSLSVANSTLVTAVFDIKSGELVVGRIYYNLLLKNNIKIGLNSDLDSQSTVDLYLGSSIYDIKYKKIETEEEYNSINLSQLYTYSNSTYTKYSGTEKPTYSPTAVYYYPYETIIDLLQSETYGIIETENEFKSVKDVYTYNQGTNVYTKISKPETMGTNEYWRVIYNNLFVTLEQYSSNNVIGEKTKALYNGNNSYLSNSAVANHLRFSITDETGEVEKGDVEVRFDNNGVKLYIKGNPTGSFTLNIFSTNGTGYGESFVINVNPYDNTEAQYSQQINRGSNAAGWESGKPVDLFKNIGVRDAENQNKGNFAFATYRESYNKNNNDKLTIFNNTEIKYQVLTFDYDTSVADIKASALWDNNTIAVPKNITTESLTNTNGEYTFTLPSVKYATPREYQIVSVRLAITYNGDTNYYFAHYLVYNPESLNVNQFYLDTTRDHVITYREKDNNGNEVGAWQSGSLITIMDTQNNGMYSAVTAIKAPDSNYSGNYYIAETTTSGGGVEATGKYTSVGSSYRQDAQNYKLNLVAQEPAKYQAKLVFGDNTYIFDLNKEEEDAKVRLYIDLSTVNETLFTNYADFTFIIEAKDGGAKLIEDVWTVKAGTTIEANNSKPLRDFFLTSEIGNQDYYNVNIIGIGTNYNSFVTGEDSSEGKTVATDVTNVTLPNGYKLQAVKYVGSGGTDVFKVEATYHVLVGHDTAMSFDFNGGSDYYINVTIDDNALKDDDGDLTTAKIDISKFVNVWAYNTDSSKGEIGFVNVDENDNFTDKSISVTISNANEFNLSVDEIDKDQVILRDVHKISKNDFVTVIITDTSGISRTIQLYFNIIINVKDKDSKGNALVNNGVMIYNATIAKAMTKAGEDNALSIDEIDNDLDLKKELLSLIKCNDRDVVVDGVVDSYTLSCYKVGITTNGANYKITYTYSIGSATYTRTLTMSGTKPSTTN